MSDPLRNSSLSTDIAQYVPAQHSLAANIEVDQKLHQLHRQSADVVALEHVLDHDIQGREYQAALQQSQPASLFSGSQNEDQQAAFLAQQMQARNQTVNSAGSNNSNSIESDDDDDDDDDNDDDGNTSLSSGFADASSALDAV